MTYTKFTKPLVINNKTQTEKQSEALAATNHALFGFAVAIGILILIEVFAPLLSKAQSIFTLIGGK